MDSPSPAAGKEYGSTGVPWSLPPTAGTPQAANPYLRYLPNSRYFQAPLPHLHSQWEAPGSYSSPYTPAPRVVVPPPPESYQTVPPRGKDETLVVETRLRITGTYREPQSLKEFKPLPAPRYVPFVVNPTISREEVTWRPAKPRQPPAVEVSHADTLEAPVAPRAGSEPQERTRRILAYDDGDAFAFSVRTLAPPPPPPPISGDDDGGPQQPDLSGLDARDLTIVQAPHQVMFFTPDRRWMFYLKPNGIKESGWGCERTLGAPPPSDSVLVPFGVTHVVAGQIGDRVGLLTLGSMSWTHVVLPKFGLPRSPSFVHAVSDFDIYLRSGDVHGVVTLWKYEVPVHEETMLGDEVVDHQRFRVRCKNMKELRSRPVEDQLVAVHLAPGVACATTVDRRGDDHTWIFKFEAKALNWLPHARIEFSHPRGVRMGDKVFFFAQDERRERTSLAQLQGRTGGTCIVAIMTLSSGAVIQPRTSNDVRIMLKPADILCLAPIPMVPNTLVCLSSDLFSYLILEVDRWEKIKTYASFDA